jgi:hypothetical protein
MKSSYPPWRVLLWLALSPLITSSAWALQVSFPASTVALRGTTVDIPVSVGNTTGLNIYSLELQFTFNPTAATFLDVLESGTILGPWTATEYHEVTSNSLRIVAAGSTPLTGSGVLLNIRFNLPLSGSGNSSLTWTQAQCRLNEGSPALTFVDGALFINNPPVISINPSTAELYSGDSIFASASGGTAPYAFAVVNPVIGTFHASGGTQGYFVGGAMGTTQLQATDFNSVIGLSGNYVVRPIKLIIPDSTILSGRTFLLPVQILIAQGGGTPRDPQAVVASIVDTLGAIHPRLHWNQSPGASYNLYRAPSYFTNLSDPGVISVPGVGDELPADPLLYRYTDYSVDLHNELREFYAVTATGGGALSIYSGQFRITYDPAVVSLVSVQRAGTLTAGFQFSYESNPTYVDVSFSNSTSLAGSGTLFYLELHVNPGSYATAITMSNALFNENLLPIYRQGSVHRIPPPSITINPGTSQETVVGDSIQFSVSGGTAPYTWHITNAGTGTVSSTGKFKALGGGLTYIWVQDNNGFTDSSALITVDDFRLIAQNASGHPGDSVTVTLQLSGNATGLGIYSTEMTLNISGNDFTFAYPILTGTLLNGWSSAFEVNGGTQIRVAASNGAALAGSGTFLQLRGRISPSATLGGRTISWNNVSLNEGNRRAYLVNGTLSIIP